MSRLALDRDPGVLDRHRGLRPSPMARALSLALPIGILLSVGFALWWLDIAVDQLGTGLVTLGKLVRLMFPPSTGGHPALLLKAMGETPAIAPAVPLIPR